MDAEGRPGSRVEDAVRVDDRVANAGSRDFGVEARVVRALREPRARGLAADDSLETGDAERELRPDAFRRREQSRQVAVGRRACHELDATRVPVLHEAREHVAAVPVPHRAHVGEVVTIEGRDRRQAAVAIEPPHLALCQPLESGEVVVKSAPQELVAHHRGERRHAHGDRERHPVAGEPVEGIEERQVALDERLVEPPLFEVPRVLGMANEREVSVKDQREVAVSHRLKVG